jgi:hypothetical protein
MSARRLRGQPGRRCRSAERLRPQAGPSRSVPVSERIRRCLSALTRCLADLAVCVGANVQNGQDVVVLAWDVEQAPVVRAVAESAYRRGARFVSAVYWDAHVSIHGCDMRRSGHWISFRTGGRRSRLSASLDVQR